jgi:hypothetical protein
LEDEADRPDWPKPALRREDNAYALNIPGLYWSVHRMLHELLGDATQRAGAEQLARSLYF